MAKPANITIKLFNIWKGALNKLNDGEKILVEMAIRHGSITNAIDRWIEVEEKIARGELAPDQKASALFSLDKGLPKTSSEILEEQFQEREDEPPTE